MVEEFAAKRKTILKNKLYGLLCEKEKDGSWEEFLDNILIDLYKFSDNKEGNYNYYLLITKLNSCRYLAYKYYRKNIFECMNLIDEMNIDELF